MGRLRKRFNWKGRLSASYPVTKVEKQKENIQIDFKVREEKYDASNPLVLLSNSQQKKDKSRISTEVPKTKILSKKKRKQLQKILERKKRKINRAEILEKLQKVQATPEELNLMTSVSTMQTSGLKKFDFDSQPSNSSNCIEKINSIKGSKKKRKNKLPKTVNKKIKYDPNIVGFDSPSDLSSSDSDAKKSETESVQHSVNKSSFSSVDTAHTTVETVDKNINAENSGLSKHSDRTITNNDSSLQNVSSSSQKRSIKTVTADKSSIKPVQSTSTFQKSSVSSEASKNNKPAVFVPVFRTPEIQAVREALPIFCEEHTIMEAVNEHPVVIIHGDTGTGKTTQVPQFLYEAGYARDKMIGITEPRRLAAVAMATRVAKEMNLPDAVSYHIRYDKTATGDKTKIKFMTDGVLLKEIRQDVCLTKYSVIIIDEAHERSIFSDVLIGLMSRIMPLRVKKGDPLKLIIMSATLRIDDFIENRYLFKIKPFLVKLDSRQYDVVVHFNKSTPEDYLEAAFKKVCRIHQDLPPGSILVFVTGKQEVTRLCKMLRKAFPFGENCNDEDIDNRLNTLLKKRKIFRKRKNKYQPFDAAPKINLDDYSVEPLDAEALQHQQSDDENLSDDIDKEILPVAAEALYVLPLYSLLPADKQSKIFQPPPPGSRLCVVATNVAETSITIPGLKYVVDTGKVKTRIYDNIAGASSTFNITWTSKASANQRAGRAGRTEGGHCYRLYSSSVFEHEFPDFPLPEVVRTPVDDVVLQLKALDIERVVEFPFPSPPDIEALKAAERRLVTLGALQDLQKGNRYKEVEKWEYSAKITRMGRGMSQFPVSPRFAKMLIISYTHSVAPYAIAVVSALSVPEVFYKYSSSVNDTEDSKVSQEMYIGIKKIGAGEGKSLKLGDAMVLLRAVALYEEAKNKRKFCEKCGLRLKAMEEIHKMRIQLTKEMNSSFCGLSIPLDLKITPPNDEQLDKLRMIVAASTIDRIARKIPNEELGKEKMKLRNAYKCLDLSEPVFIHPSSILRNRCPDYVVYQEIIQTSRHFMKMVTEVEQNWLPIFAPGQCEFSPPLETPAPQYHIEADRIMCTMSSTFGPWQWQLPPFRLPIPAGEKKYKWFCYFLLDGSIYPLFNSYKKHYVCKISNMIEPWTNLVPVASVFLKAIVNRKIDTVKALNEVWKDEPNFLLAEYCRWLPAEKRGEVARYWPPQR